MSAQQYQAQPSALFVWARYIDTISTVAKALGYIAKGLTALFFILLLLRLVHILNAVSATSDVAYVLSTVANGAIMPLMPLLGLVFAINLLAEIFESEAEMLKEYIGSVIVGELLLRKRVQIAVLMAKYGFNDASKLFRIVREAAGRMNIQVTLSPSGDEILLSGFA